MAAPPAVSKPVLEFGSLFAALTNCRPYPWQQKLFDAFLKGEIREDISLPTGSGKTSILAVWLIALAAGAPVPRRLVWVVDRRVVVDQATEEAVQLASRINDESIVPALRSLRDALAALSVAGPDQLLAISTLRGEKEDNREWSKDPARPAIIVGTVDMIGSRLLFSGYGDGRSRRAMHAGLLGHDVLLVNDEAHLTPAFASLVGKLAGFQSNGSRGKRFQVLRLSATHQSGRSCWPESLADDQRNPEFRKIFEATKRLEILSAGKQYSKLLELATAPGPARTLIFLRKPSDVLEFSRRLASKLGRKSERVICLTGTMRGFERDQLVRSPVFQDFAARQKPSESCWLIATSAAEVGVNISSDRLITDLDTADHLIQRFGRLNRFGETEGYAYLLVTDTELRDSEHKSDKQKEPRKCNALAYFRELLANGNDISTARLFNSPPPASACSESPLEAQLHKWLVDVWSQTSLGAHPARPPVEPWLHGKQEKYPETYVAWREDVRELTEAITEGLIDDDDLKILLRKYDVLAHERLREPTNQLQQKFAELTQKTNPSARLVCVRPDGCVAVLKLGEIANGKAEDLAYSQLILPPGCGWLDQGMFSPAPPEGNPDAPLTIPYDLAGCELDQGSGEPRYSDKRACYRAVPAEDGWQLQRLGAVPPEKREPPISLPNLASPALSGFAAQRGWRLAFRVDLTREEEDTGANTTVLLYFKQLKDKRQSDKVEGPEHLKAVAEKAAKLAEKLGLDEKITRALVLAGHLHDLGKQEPIWQRAVGNRDGAPWIAKSAMPMRPRLLGGFRHELASLRYAEKQLAGEPAEVRDLALHLIAAHHGHARPCFETKTYDRQHRRESERLALEAAQRFGRLQQTYGAWGLAYLEAVFKAADALASPDAEEYA